MISADTGGFIFHCLSAIALAWFLFLLYRTQAVRKWPTVIGTVIESSVEKDPDLNRYPQVRYRYSVNGTEYTSDRILPHGRLATTGTHAVRVVARYKTGSRVRVRVNPRRPADSALETGLPFIVYFMLVVSVVAFWWMGNLFQSGFGQQSVQRTPDRQIPIAWVSGCGNVKSDKSGTVSFARA